MKKLLLFLLIISLATCVNAQEEEQNQNESKFPYGKMLKMSDDELSAAKFKYDRYKNQWVLRKLNGLNKASNIMSALSGVAANYVPHKDDYQVTIQRGTTGVAYIEVNFFDNNIYHDIITFAMDNGSDVLETKSGKITKTQFGYDNYLFSLISHAVSQGAISSGNYRSATTKDESYESFVFTIYTDIEPASLFLEKQTEAQNKRDAAGKKKKSAAELM